MLYGPGLFCVYTRYTIDSGFLAHLVIYNSLPTAVSGSGLSDVTTTTEEVCRLLSTVKFKTASGSDGISSHMLGNTA